MKTTDTLTLTDWTARMAVPEPAPERRCIPRPGRRAELDAFDPERWLADAELALLNRDAAARLGLVSD